jgi:hypothetical protein
MLLDIDLNTNTQETEIKNEYETPNEYQNLDIETIVNMVEKRTKQQIKKNILKCICKQILRLFLFVIIFAFTCMGILLSGMMGDDPNKHMSIRILLQIVTLIITLLISIILIRCVP